MSGLLINANSLNIPLADGSVQCVVTSPPYYGLRDYGVDGQIGLEVTPDEYIANLVEVFRECKRILRDDGTLWVNIGDSYNGSAPNQSGQNGYNDGRENRDKRYSTGGVNGLKPKDLIGIPWMLAFALRADGWYLRQDIIWHKPNPMPESVKDRCTKSHEYIFLLSKSPRYYYDSEAVKEIAVEGSDMGVLRSKCHTDGEFVTWHNPNIKKRQDAGIDSRTAGNGFRNKRDVWTVTTKPYKGAHYATFNPELIKPCILAGAPETCCAKCGAPYERVVERDRKARNELPKDDPRYRPNTYHGSYENINGKGDAGYTFTQTLGFEPTCDCNAGTSSGIVFDPFVGSGTTVATAIQLGRKGIGIDLSFKYLYENAKARVDEQRLPLMEMMRGENANTIR